ncbi:MAG: DUF1294 domain-containing protein [Firmicutes bacterium]|nr:DUF1294 domain-containing protein [Bacillota bacterium]
MTKYLFIVYLLWNLIVFFAYGIDKRKAVKDKWRTPESTLLLMALLMGAAGALAGMRVFHHKTKHAKFTVGVPLCLVVNLAVIALYIRVFLWK